MENKELRLVEVDEVLSLRSISVEGPFGLSVCSLSSERWLSVQESSQKAGQLALVDINQKTVMRRTVSADAAIIHPNGHLLALRAGRNLQLFNLADRCRLKTTELTEDKVELWKWVGNSTLAIITATGVYHWTLSGSADSTLMMKKNLRLLTGVSVNYHVNDSLQWLLLVTVSVVGGRVVGCCQLHSVEQKCCQILDADAAVFTSFTLPRNSSPLELIAFASHTDIGGKLCIAMLGKPKDQQHSYLRKTVDLEFSGIPGDFPIALEAETNLGVIYVVWKSGFVAIHDVENGGLIYASRVVVSGIFSIVPRSIGGILILNKLGQLISVCLKKDELVPFLEGKNELELAARLAMRTNLPGAENVILQWFEYQVKESNYGEAAWLAANAPHSLLRTSATLERLRQMPSLGISPLMTYFGELLDKGRLFYWEAIELCRPVLQQGRQDLVEKWLREDRLECSEELGDILLPYSHNLALSVFVRASAVSKVFMCFAETGQFQKLFEYSQKMACSPDIFAIVKGLLITNREYAVPIATMAIEEWKYEIDARELVNLFLENELFDESVTLITKAEKQNYLTDGHLQTKLLCILLHRSPHLAEALISSHAISHFNRSQVAILCEEVGLLHCALELHIELTECQRVLTHANQITLECLFSFFKSLDIKDVLTCLHSILADKRAENVKVAVDVAMSCFPRVAALDLIQVFECANETNGLFLLLNCVVGLVDDEEIHFKYVITAVKLDKIKALEMFCHTSNCINPVKVRSFLMGKKLSNLCPLMILCDRFNFVEELVVYLVNLDLTQHLTYFITHFSFSHLPKVLDCLLSLGITDKSMLAVVSLAKDELAAEVISVVERYGQLQLILSWLECLKSNGSRNIAVHTALAKVAILNNQNPEQFLLDNHLHDFHAIGKFCEKMNPELAVVAYSRGNHDEDLMRVCNEVGLIKPVARYLLHRCDIKLWNKALASDYTMKNSLVENIAHLAATECYTTEEVSLAVKALIDADLPQQLLQLLETLVFDCSEFATHSNLQNLLILWAMKTDQSRVMDLITRLRNYDSLEVAVIAKKNGMYEEAFTIYNLSGENSRALEVLLQDLADWDRAEKYSKQCDSPEIWAQIGKQWLDAGKVELAVDALIRAGDTSNYQAVLQATTDAGLWNELSLYLETARKHTKEPAIDTELLFVYAVTNNLKDMERMISEAHLANVQLVAERCFKDKLLEAAKILFMSINCHSRLSETHAMLGDLIAAVVSAQKAGNVQSWATLCDIALEKEDIEIACTAARQLIMQADQTETLVDKFEQLGLVTEIIALLESFLNSNHIGGTVLTELALLYIRFESEKCHAYLETWWTKIHVPRVLKALKQAHLWEELALLLERHGDYCETVVLMMAHPTEAWHHIRFKNLLTKVINSQIIQPMILFYLEYKPLLLNEILLSLGTRLDASRVIATLTNAGHLAFGRAYLESRLDEDNSAVNVALCDLLLQENNWLGLRSLLSTQQNIDAAALISRLEGHNSMGFRLVTVDLYRRCKRWSAALLVCQRENLHREAISVAAESSDKGLVGELLSWFQKNNMVEAFSAALLQCYHLIEPDKAIELAWRSNAWDFAMPYIIQVVHDLCARLSVLEKQRQIQKDEDVTSTLPRMLMWPNEKN